MRSFLFSFFLFIFLSGSAQPPTWQWAQNSNCTASDNSSSVATDIFGNVYSTGYFYGSNMTFSTTTLANNGNYDCFLVKYNSSGNVLWAKSIGDAFDEVGNGVCTDNGGNVYITGYFTSNVLTIGSYTFNNLGGTDVFVVKYDPNGNIVWAKQFASNMSEESNAITCDAFDNVLITGSFMGSNVSFGTGTISTNGGNDVYVAKYDKNGNEIWARLIGGAGTEVGYGIACEGPGDVYVTGSFKSSAITFSTSLLNCAGGTDYILAKYDAAGNELWANGAGGSFDEIGTCVKVLGTGIFTTGYFKSTNLILGTNTFTNTSVGSADVFIARHNSSGIVNWSAAWGGNLDDIGYGIAQDASGNTFLAGHIHSSFATFGTYSLTCSGVGDAFITKLNTVGLVVWAEAVGSLQDEGIGGLATDATGDVYAAGFYYSSNVNFGSNTLTNNGNSDMFVARLSNPPNGIPEKNDLQQKNLLYPNPTCCGFYINAVEHNATVQIFDMAGKELLRMEIPNSLTVFVETENLPGGIYLVRFTGEGISYAQKLSVVK